MINILTALTAFQNHFTTSGSPVDFLLPISKTESINGRKYQKKISDRKGYA